MFFQKSVDIMKYIRSSLCQLGWLSCFGCCGHSFRDKKSVAKAIADNTVDFHRAKNSGVPVNEWMNREKDLHPSGVCYNLVYDHEKDEVFCPLHPERNGGHDHRIDHHSCDILHVCKTAFFFELWDKERQDAFLKFLRKKKRAGELDWYTYSLKMADDSLLEEFEGLKWD